ncbi:hypothetical protein [Bacillus daqingensis]
MMLSFINLLFESPLLLFFILAAIFSFIQSRSGQKQEENSQPRVPEQRQEQSDREASEKEFDWRDILFETEEKQEEKQPQRQEKAQTDSPAQTEMEKHYEQLRKKQRQAEKSASKLQKSPIVKKDITATAEQKVTIDFNNMTKQDVVKGIVWAEVLGKPKAAAGRNRNRRMTR